MSDQQVLDHIRALKADEKVLVNADQIGLELQTGLGRWETVYSITARPGGRFWARTYNYTYPTVRLSELRIARVAS